MLTIVDYYIYLFPVISLPSVFILLLIYLVLKHCLQASIMNGGSLFSSMRLHVLFYGISDTSGKKGVCACV